MTNFCLSDEYLLKRLPTKLFSLIFLVLFYVEHEADNLKTTLAEERCCSNSSFFELNKKTLKARWRRPSSFPRRTWQAFLEEGPITLSSTSTRGTWSFSCAIWWSVTSPLNVFADVSILEQTLLILARPLRASIVIGENLFVVQLLLLLKRGKVIYVFFLLQ